MDENKNKDIIQDNNECTSRGLCSISPAVAALQELIRYFIFQSAYYIVNLEKLNLFNKNINLEIIKIISSLTYINECTELQMYSFALRCYYIFENSKERYIKACKENHIEPDLIKEYFIFKDENNPANAITIGYFLIKNRNKTIDIKIKDFLELLFVVYKSAAFNISHLSDFNICTEEYSTKIIHSIYELQNPKIEIIKKEISKIALLDFNLRNKIVESLFDNFGTISKVNVSYSTRKGKCILVSGCNFLDLYNILEITKDKNIDIYSHSNLLLAHSLEKFKEYKHFRGHYMNIYQNSVADFATFPGAILLTKNSENNTQYLYRGKIFSHDYITPQGVVKLENSDYEPIFKYALSAKGFSKGQKRPDCEIGFNLDEMDKLFFSLTKQIKEGKLERIYVIGNSDSDCSKDLLNKLKRKDNYIISFCRFENAVAVNNITSINIGNYSPLMAYIIKKHIIDTKMIDYFSFIFPTCNLLSITLILGLHTLGVKDIFISECSARTINPLVFDAFKENYNIKSYIKF